MSQSASLKIGRTFLHTPGPTYIPQSVRNAMQRQSYDLADQTFFDICNRCVDALKPIFGTKHNVFIYAANGHGAWDAVAQNLFTEGDQVLLVNNGGFSYWWGEHLSTLGVKVHSVGQGTHAAAGIDAIQRALADDKSKKIKAVLVAQIDTASSIKADVLAIRRVLDALDHDALLLADVVASLGTMPFEMDAWGVDVAFSASQKAMMGPAGLAMVAVSHKAMDVAAANPVKSVYWNWAMRHGADNYTQFGGTAPQHGIFGLEAALDRLNQEGLAVAQQRHDRLAAAVHAAVACWAAPGAMAFNVNAPQDRANSVTTILTPEGFVSEKLRNYARSELNLVLAGGLGPLSNKAIRIGHMGDLNEAMILGCLAATEVAMRKFDLPFKSGLDAAVKALA